MKRVNNFEITGNCVADAKIITCNNQRKKVSFSIAINYLYETTAQGDKKTVVEYFDIESWHESTFKLIKKGAPVIVKGFRTGKLVNDKPRFTIVANSIEAFVPDPKQ